MVSFPTIPFNNLSQNARFPQEAGQDPAAKGGRAVTGTNGNTATLCGF